MSYKLEIGKDVLNNVPTPDSPEKVANKQYVDDNAGQSNTAAGAFSGVFDVSGGNKYYDDYSGTALGELSLSASKALGATSTVRISGGSSFSFPTAWNFSGQPISTNEAKFNEITVMYITDTDIRAINRVVENSAYTPPVNPENNLTNLYLWLLSDSVQITENANGGVSSFSSKAGTSITLSNTGNTAQPDFDVDHITFGDTNKLTKDTADAKLLPGQDFEGYFIFKANETTDGVYLINTSGSNRFGIALRAGELAVGTYNGTSFNTKSTAFSDTTSKHKLRFKLISGVLNVWLDGTEITTSSQNPYTTSETQFSLGGLDVSSGDYPANYDFIDMFINNGAMTAQEVTDMETYINDTYGI